MTETPRDDAPTDDDAVTPAEDAAVTPADDAAVTPADDGAVTPTDDDAVTPAADAPAPDAAAADPTDAPTVEALEAGTADVAEVTEPADVPPEPVAADAAGDAAEASKVDVEDERPAPPARAREPRAGDAPAPETQPLGQGETPDPEEYLEDAPRVRPEIPGADLIPDIVLEGEDTGEEELGADGEPVSTEDVDEVPDQPITVTIDLAAGARYPTKGYIAGKRKSAVARVYLKPGAGVYLVNGRPLDVYFPRATLQRTIRQPLETVGYEAQMDVVAKIHGGGVSSQADALRHGIARALLDADPNLRGELKRRGFLTRDARVKERRKAGLKKARKRPQFSKR